jgi:predicted house-cleaning noncanonical NTP pyrophosphatase (MazG superfamily)
METTQKQVSTPVQSWTRRAEKHTRQKTNYHAELSNWLQRAITEAEKNKNFNKKDQLLTLLEDL